MTMTLRLRAATVTLAAATLVGGGVVVALPAQAANVPTACKGIYSTYQQDKKKSDVYLDIYRHSSGSQKTKAYELYLEYRNKAQRDLADYDTCLHNH